MIVHKLLAKQPGERFVSASQVAHTLEQCLAHVQQPTAVELPELCRMPVAGSRWGKWSAIGVVALVSGSLALAYIPDGQGARPTKSLDSPSPVNQRESQPSVPVSPAPQDSESPATPTPSGRATT